MSHYVVATTRPWNLAAFAERSPGLGGEWHLVSDPGELTLERLDALSPRYVFFPHWSWKVAKAIVDSYECVCFHMTDVPYGRGGSPLQNLIVRGHKETRLTALRMVEELDAGPVYAKRPLDLSGSAQSIYTRAAALTFDMMADIATNEPVPQPQRGDVTVFERRTPAQSALPAGGELAALYDHVRMLDADTYPRAFLRHGAFMLEFSGAEIDTDGEVTAHVRISRAPADEER